jgi:hypothetical protein
MQLVEIRKLMADAVSTAIWQIPQDEENLDA